MLPRVFVVAAFRDRVKEIEDTRCGTAELVP